MQRTRLSLRSFVSTLPWFLVALDSHTCSLSVSPVWPRSRHHHLRPPRLPAWRTQQGKYTHNACMACAPRMHTHKQTAHSCSCCMPGVHRRQGLRPGRRDARQGAVGQNHCLRCPRCCSARRDHLPQGVNANPYRECECMLP